MIEWDGRQLNLVDLPYNTTAVNERAVELAVTFDWLTGRTGHGLEVGNVLAHYGHTGHRVVDLTEQSEHVDNLDVFDIGGRYDWIVSISTIEHVHWDDRHDPDAAALAIAHLRSLLATGGHLLVTIPIGWHPTLDRLLPLDADLWGCWSHESSGWRPCDLEPVDYGPRWANKVWIGEWRN